MRYQNLLALPFLFASLQAQQTTVVPSRYATTEANSYTAYPFGLGTQHKVQYLYDKRLVGVAGLAVQKIALRGQGGLAAAAKTGVDLEIAMSSTSTSPWAASGTFASNVGADYKIVFTRKLVNLPAQPSTPTPAPFVTQFPLDQPFPYATALGNLLIEYTTYAIPAGSYSHDTSYTQAVVNVATGTACGLAMATTGGLATTATSTLNYNLTTGPASGTGVLLLGTQLLPAPIPLPFSQGCLVHQDVLLLMQKPLSATGTATFNIPLHYENFGLTLQAQAVAADAGLTALVASPSIRTTIGGYDPHTRIYNLSNATSPTGTVQIGVGIVTELTY